MVFSVLFLLFQPFNQLIVFAFFVWLFIFFTIVVALGEVNPMRPQSYEKGMRCEKTKKIARL